MITILICSEAVSLSVLPSPLGTTDNELPQEAHIGQIYIERNLHHPIL